MASEEDVSTLAEFVQYNILPRRVKVVEGYCSTDGDEFPSGDLIHLMEVTCPKAALIHPSTGRKLSVPSSHPARFQVVASGGEGSSVIVLRGVRAVAATRPLAVRLTAPYSSCADAALQLKKGDHLKLLRFVQRGGRKFIECKSSHLSRLVLLPVWDEAGEFEERASDSYYTLADLLSTLPRPERRVKLAADIINERNPLPGGIKAGTELVLQQPLIMVKYYLVNSPGTIKEIPATLDISVSAREDTYSGQFQAGYPLKHFVADNRRSFPLTAIVSDWFEQSTIADNHDVTPGVTLMFHDVAEQQKILATCGDACFAIPKSYAAEFRFVARTFSAVCELPATHKGFTFRAIQSTNVKGFEHNARHNLTGGREYIISHAANIKQSQEGDVLVRVLVVQLKQQQGSSPLLYIPMNAPCNVHEVIDPRHLPTWRSVTAIPEHSVEFPIDVMFDSPCSMFEMENDPLPRGKVVTLQAYIRENVAVVSKVHPAHVLKTSFHLPLRSSLLMTYLDKVKRKVATPSLSTMDHCPEKVSTQDYGLLLQNERIYYERPPTKPASGPTLPVRQAIKGPHRPIGKAPAKLPAQAPLRATAPPPKAQAPPPKATAPPPKATAPAMTAAPAPSPKGRIDPKQGLAKILSFGSGRRKSSDEQNVSGAGRKSADPLRRSISDIPSRQPLDKKYEIPAMSKSDEEDDEDGYHSYTRLARNQDLYDGQPKPFVEIPSDGDLSGLTALDLLVILENLGIPNATLAKWKQARISGSMFAAMSDDDLRAHGIDTVAVRHFRDKSNDQQDLISFI